jgi:hypothetical protein
MSTSIANLAVDLNSERYTKRLDVMDKYGPYDMQYTKGCTFCEMLWHNQQPEKEDWIFGLATCSFSRNDYWVRRYRFIAVPETKDSIENDSTVMHGRRECRRSAPVIVHCTTAKASLDGMYHPQPVQISWDYDKARRWLETCARTQKSSCAQQSSIVAGTYLIDCEKLAIVTADGVSQWIALSYVWGNNQQASELGIERSLRAGYFCL